jgi:PhnB protein
MTQLFPYLRFNGKCREAMNFYKSCLGGELNMQTVAESAIAAQLPPAAGNNIMHATLTKGSLMLAGSDMAPDEGIQRGNHMVLLLNCSSPEEINSFFEKLSAGGQVSMPLQTEFWGDTFGMLTDKFGNEWMLNYAKPKE